MNGALGLFVVLLSVVLRASLWNVSESVMCVSCDVAQSRQTVDIEFNFDQYGFVHHQS